MAFTEQEKQLIIYGKQNGKTQAEVEEALYRLRTGRPYSTTPPAAQEQQSTYSSMVSDAASAGMAKVKQGIDTVVNAKSPIGVVAGGTKAAAGAVEAATSPLAPLFSPLGKLIGWVSDKISDNKAVQDFAQSPAGEATAKVADFAADVGVVAGAATGAKVSPALASKASSALSEARAAMGDINSVGSLGIKEAVSKAVDPAALMQRVARVSKGKQADFENLAGQSVGQYLVDRGIFGTPDKIVDQLYERFTGSVAEADKALASLPGTFKNTAVGVALKELLQRERSVSNPGAISRNLERVQALQKKHTGQGLSMEEVNEVKRLYERTVRLDYVKQNLPDKVEKANNLDSAIRTWQLSNARQLGLKNLDQINKETQLARQLMDDLGLEYSGQAGNNAISLTDWITLSGGTAANAAMFLTKKALTSKTVMSKIAETTAGSTPKVGKPTAEMGTPTIDNYLQFLERTEK